MMRAARFRRRLGPAALVALLLWAVPAAMQAEPGPTTLRVAAPTISSVGEDIHFTVTLLDGEGQPIVGAMVQVYERVAFMDTAPADVLVAAGSTAEDGTARIHYVARRAGARAFTVSYAGDEDHAAQAASFEMPVAAGGQIYQVEPPAGIPGVSRFLVSGILIIVWGTMLIIALHVVAIVRAGGPPEGEGA